MKYITYKNIYNPHVTIHKDGCSQIKKRGGKHEYGQGEYLYHNSYDEAYAYANSAKSPLINCSFCKPKGEDKFAILIPTDDWAKQEKLTKFLRKREWTTWGLGISYRIHPPVPPPYYVYFFHKRIVKYRALCLNILGMNEVPLKNILPEFLAKRPAYQNEFIIKSIEKIKETPLDEFKSFYYPQKSMNAIIRKLAYVVDPFASKLKRAFQNTPACNFWLEQYWPADRDLTELYMWFNEKKQAKNDIVRTGDRVLFYEVKNHPTESKKGSKTIFASGTVLDDVVSIPKKEQLRGGKRWVFKRLVRSEYALNPKYGIPLVKAKELLGMKGWPQTGFQIKDPQKFKIIEAELRKMQEQDNLKRSFNNKGKPFQKKHLVQFHQSGKGVDEISRLLALEKAANAHKDLLNKLNQVICSHKYNTSEDQKADLFATISNITWIFEVKSTNDKNFLSQARHGIAQLYEYRFLCFEANRHVNLCLVVQTPPPEELRWVVKYLQTLNIFFCWSVPKGFYSAYGAQLEFLKNK